MKELALKTNENVEFFLFLPPSPCRNDCAIYGECNSKDLKGGCEVERIYLQKVVNSFSVDIGKFVTQSVANKISYHIIPLYQMLFKLRLEACRVLDPFYETDKGAIGMHPVFKEIRMTIAAIESSLRSTGLDKEYLRAVEEIAVKGAAWSPTQGNSDYYAQMLGDLKDISEKNTRKMQGRAVVVD